MNRKRIAQVIALVGVALLVGHLASFLPRNVDVRYDLGPDHGEVTDVHLSYLFEGEEMKGVRFHFAHGAPKVVHHRVELPPGDYLVVASLSGPALHRTHRRGLAVPTEGPVRYSLDEK
jgi:hypothetical protein